MKKIEHIGIAVTDINKSNELFSKIFGKENYKSEIVESEGVITSFFQIGENKIELVEASNPDSPISKYLQKNREGIHHIAFEVEDIVKEIGDDYIQLASDLSDSEQYIDTGSLVFNGLVSGSIFGGVSSSKITAIAGESSTGKTFFALAVA